MKTLFGRRKIPCYLLVVGLLSVLTGVLVLRQALGGSLSGASKSPPVGGKQPKIILTWTTFFKEPFRANYYMPECGKEPPCLLTTDRAAVKEASALVFHGRTEDFSWDDVPRLRLPWQRYVFLVHESPTNNRAETGKVGGFFNWTMTYRHDSDIPYPYGVLARRPTSAPASLDFKSVWARKKRPVVWFVSWCQTEIRREEIVKALQSYVAIDIFGACGNRSVCPKSAGTRCSNELIDRDYKFFIAFENSICKDYITEKYWGRWNLMSVPIVLQRRIYEHLLPPNSFIAVDDFPSMQKLGEYLNKLDKNEAAYLKHFEWRLEGWTSVFQTPGFRMGFCRLCDRLWAPSTTRKSYEDLEAWWVAGSACDHGDFAKRILSAH